MNLMFFLRLFFVTAWSAWLGGCAGGPAVNPRPHWIDNPGNGVSASAGMHVRGKVAQEELAIHRAREEYAKRFGVTIAADLTTVQNVVDGRASTATQKFTQEATRQSNVRAVVKAKWHDTVSDVLWVWLVPAE